ncbi:MAG: nitroreductase family protein [Clostridia bacterium]|nr:nitroreductase family protein [Clostridia bacterium]
MIAMLAAMLLCLNAAAACAENGTIEVIMNAGTTQAFSDATVKEEDLEAILHAGLVATSSINQQPWYFVVITNADVMAEIAGSGMDGMGGAPAGMTPPEGMNLPAGMTPPEGMSAHGGMGGATPSAPAASGTAKAAMGDSPVAIVIYMNTATMSPDASFECGLATQNMVIAASALGYGTKIVSSPR